MNVATNYPLSRRKNLAKIRVLFEVPTPEKMEADSVKMAKEHGGSTPFRLGCYQAAYFVAYSEIEALREELADAKATIREMASGALVAEMAKRGQKQVFE